MVRYDIFIVPKVLLELERIKQRIRMESEQRADLMSERFEKGIDSLKVFPRRNPVQDRRRDPAMTAYYHVVMPYILYYRVDDKAKLVRVLSIMHGARRQPKRFR